MKAEEEEGGALASSLKNENEALRQANEKLAAEIAKLGQELATYELRLGKGDYNPATTKVTHTHTRTSVSVPRKMVIAESLYLRSQILHMTNNPTALARRKNSEVVRINLCH
jgi:hypothetical protein